jgi:hypothetical protein
LSDCAPPTSLPVFIVLLSDCAPPTSLPVFKVLLSECAPPTSLPVFKVLLSDCAPPTSLPVFKVLLSDCAPPTSLPVINGASVVQSLVFRVVFCRSLFVVFLFGGGVGVGGKWGVALYCLSLARSG